MTWAVMSVPSKSWMTVRRAKARAWSGRSSKTSAEGTVWQSWESLEAWRFSWGPWENYY